MKKELKSFAKFKASSWLGKDLTFGLFHKPDHHKTLYVNLFSHNVSSAYKKYLIVGLICKVPPDLPIKCFFLSF